MNPKGDKPEAARLKELLVRAVEWPGAVVSADPATADELQSLLAARARMPEILRAESLSKALGLDEPDDAMPVAGDCIAGRYLLDRVLFQTPQSVVYLARDKRLAENQVVLKVMRSRGADAERVRALLRNEMEALARVRHPGVAGLVDEGVIDPPTAGAGQPFVVMQYMPGRSLRNYLATGPVPAKLAREVIRQAAAILAATHAVGIVHRDVKPENIVVDERPSGEIHVAVVDFGIALTRTQSTTRRTLSTPAYAAPELLRGESSAQTDVYSLAAVAREILPNLPAEARRVLEKAQAEDPAHRPIDAPTFAEAFLDALDAPKRRQRLAAIAVACVAVLVIVGLWEGLRPATPRMPARRQLTSMKGVELDVAFSPDGQRIYFAHGAGQQEQRKLYTMATDSGVPEQLTFGAGVDQRPTVSRDGEMVAYIHTLLSIPAELRVMHLPTRETRTVRYGDFRSLCFGAEAHVLWFTEWVKPLDVGVIHRMDLRTGDVETFPPPPGIRGDIEITVSPDGSRIAFARYETLEAADVYVQTLGHQGRPEGKPRKVTSLARRVFQPVWYPSGDQLLLLSGTLTNRTLWKVDRLHRQKPRVREVIGSGDRIEQVAIDAANGRLAIIHDREDCDLWSYPLSSDGLDVDGAQPSRLLSSTSLDEELRIAPDGQRVAFFSERSGALQVWAAESVTATPVRLSDFKSAEKTWLHWSPTGLLSVFARMPRDGSVIYQWRPGDSAGLHKVFATPSMNRVVGISADGQSVYVTPEDRSQLRLERWTIGSNERQLVAPVEAGFVRESDDGQWLYYARRHEAEGLFRMHRNGGEESRIIERLSRRNTFTIRNGWIYYAAPEPTVGIYGHRLRDGFQSLIYELDRIPGWGIDVSPDGRTLVIPLYDFDDADIYVSDTLP
jgi:Tol biopolymer transport system component